MLDLRNYRVNKQSDRPEIVSRKMSFEMNKRPCCVHLFGMSSIWNSNNLTITISLMCHSQEKTIEFI